MKMKCSKCGGIFEGPVDACPHCGVKFKKPEAPKAEEPKPAAPAPEKAPEQPKVEANVPATTDAPVEEGKKAKKVEPDTGSYWDGHLIQLIGWRLLTGFVAIITLGIMVPWGVCKLHGWYCKHRVYDGYRLTFDGKTGQLIGNWIKWVLLSIITIGIYAFFVPMKIEAWKAKHTHLVPDEK